MLDFGPGGYAPVRVGTSDTHMANVELVNCFPPPTAIWRYGHVVKAALGRDARLATVCLGGFDFVNSSQTVGDLYGNWTTARRIRSVVNYSCTSIVLRGLSARLRDSARNGAVLHYLAEEIPPWVDASRTFVTIHGNPMATIRTRQYYSFGSTYRIAVSMNLRRYASTAHAIVQSRYVEQGLREFGYDGPISVVPPAVDPLFLDARDRNEARARFGFDPEDIVILSVSTAERRKNLTVIPKVMRELPSRFKLVRVGPPVPLARTLRILSESDLAELYRASDVLLFPTLEEGFGLPVIEAFASQLPVVTSDIPVMREVAGEAAILVSPTDPRQLADACKLAVDSSSALAARGTSRLPNFSLDRLRTGLNAVYSGRSS